MKDKVIAAFFFACSLFCTYVLFDVKNKDFEFIVKCVQTIILSAMCGVGALIAWRYKRGVRTRKAFQQDEESLIELNCALRLYDKEKYQEALDALEVLQLKCENNQDMIMVRFWYAMCLYRMERYDEASRVYDEVLRINALFLDSALFMGRCYFKTGHKDIALRILRTAICRNEYSEDAYCELALCCIATGNFEEARERAERALTMNPETDAVAVLALYYAWNGKKTHALAYLDKYNGKNKQILCDWIDGICNGVIDMQSWDASSIFELHELKHKSGEKKQI